MDILSTEVRGKTIFYATFKKQKIRVKEPALEKDITNIEQNLINYSTEELTNKQTELKAIRKKKMQGQCIRAKIKWIEDGGKPSKYFTSLESRNYISKQISQLKILDEAKSFYENLYKKREIIESEVFITKLKKIEFPKLSDTESKSVEGPLTKSEILSFFL